MSTLAEGRLTAARAIATGRAADYRAADTERDVAQRLIEFDLLLVMGLFGEDRDREASEQVRAVIAEVIDSAYARPVATITITLALDPTSYGAGVDLTEPLHDLAAIMAVQAEDGLYIGGHPDAEAGDASLPRHLVGENLADLTLTGLTVTIGA